MPKTGVQFVRKYNFIRPIFLIVVAFLVNSIVTNICILMGAEMETAGNIGFIAMIIAAIVMFMRFRQKGRNP